MRQRLLVTLCVLALLFAPACDGGGDDPVELSDETNTCLHTNTDDACPVEYE